MELTNICTSWDFCHLCCPLAICSASEVTGHFGARKAGTRIFCTGAFLLSYTRNLKALPAYIQFTKGSFLHCVCISWIGFLHISALEQRLCVRQTSVFVKIIWLCQHCENNLNSKCWGLSASAILAKCFSLCFH